MSRLQRGIYVFYQYGDGTGNLVYSFFDGGSWQTVNELVPNTLTCGPPAAAFYIDSYNNEKIYCPHQGADDEGNGTTEFWYNVFDGTGWSGDAQRSNTLLTYHPSAVVYRDQIYVFHQGADPDNDGCPRTSALWYKVYQGGGQGEWLPDAQVPNTTMRKSPSAIQFNDQLLCFHRGDNGASSQLWVNTLGPLGQWLGDQQVEGPSFTNSPAAVVYNGALWCFYQSNDGSNNLHAAVLEVDGSNVQVQQDQPVPATQLWYSPAPCVFNNRLYCFHHTANSDNTLNCQVLVGGNWVGDYQIPDVLIASSPSVLVIGDS